MKQHLNLTALLLGAIFWTGCAITNQRDSVRMMTYNTHLISPAMRCLPDFVEQSELEKVYFSIFLLGSLDAGDIAAKLNVTPDEAAAIIECIIHAEEIAPDEAKIIAANILKINPDMVAFNEVFDDEAKQVLVDKLSGAYPHYIKKVGGDVFDTEDSGLMFFSKFPLLKLPQPVPAPPFPLSDFYRFVEYDACASADCWAAKGACFVKVQNPFTKEVYPIVVTHMQADYGGETGANAGDRKEQWENLIDLVNAQDNTDILTDHVIVLGDLNVQGAKGIWVNDGALNGSAEWRDFATTARKDNLFDGWANILPRTLEKGQQTVTDPGITHAGDERLDYILFNRDLINQEWGCVQHMKILNPGESDHLAAWTDFNRYSDFCSPRTAWENPPYDTYLNEYPPKTGGYDATRIAHPGGMQWFHFSLDKPSTVGIVIQNAFNPSKQKGVAIELYAPHDFSNPIPHYLGEKSFSVELDDSTLVYVVPKDFYVRAYSPSRNWKGDYSIGVHAHTCSDQNNACRLVVNDPVYYDNLFLAGQAIGGDDQAWFQIDVTDTADSGKPQLLHFRCDSTKSADLLMELFDKKTLYPVKLTAETSTVGTAFQLVSAEEKGPLGLYLKIRRKDINKSLRFRVGWASNLCRLYGSDITLGAAPKMKLTCKDETDGLAGSEAGDDEIHLQFNVDGKGFKQVFGADYDCNSGGVSKTFGNNKKSVRFLEKVVVRIIEGDGDGNPDDASSTKAVEVLPVDFFPPSQFVAEPSDEQKARIRKTKSVFKFEGGEYWFEYAISHQIPEGN
jgi:Endonuclease/Exonuclease/phosphatase family